MKPPHAPHPIAPHPAFGLLPLTPQTLPTGSVPIKLSQNGKEYEPLALAFTVFAPLPVKTALTPSKGLLSGGYEIYLGGG